MRISICLDTVASDSGGLSLPPVPAYTDEQGRYELAVPYGFTGKIVPHKLGYQFEPRYREYADLQASLDGQDFTGTIRTPSETVIVAGRATLASGEGLADVSILADGLSDGPSSGSLIAIGGSAAMTRTDEQGYYSLELPLGWTGRVAAFMPWLDFLPECYEFAGLEQNVENADFIGERLRTHVIVAGQAIEPDGDGAANVLMTVSADNGTSVAPALGMPAFLTDEYGYYRIPLPLGFTGRIEPVKFGYRFDPSFRAYEDLRIDLEGEDYFALDMLSFEISGNVATAAGEPVSGVVMIASPASLGSAPGTPGDSSPGTAFVRLRAITDENGFYSLAVPEGWSGVVKPHKGLWTFEPEEREYTVVMENIAGQDYLAASPAMATLSGSVHTAEGEPIGGVILAANHARLEGEPAVALSEDPMALCVAANSAVTSDTGFYSLQVPVGWHGRVTPYKPGYSFLPPYRLYEDVAGDMADQDYIGEYNPLFVSGYVLTEEGAPVRGVLLTGSHGVGPALTNASGYYRLRVPFGRPFRVMPRKPGYAFDPVSRDYGPLAESLENENYTASARPNLPIPPALGMCEDLAGGMMRMQWANCGETPMAHLGLIWDWYGENWLAGDDGSPWRLFGGTTWEGDFGLGATGAYFAWISSYYQDGLWLPCQNPMAFMQMSGVPHTPRSFQAQNMGAGQARLQWKPDIYGAWHAQFIAYNATAGEWAVSQGPGGQGLWHFLAFPHDDFLNGQMDLGLAAGAQYWIYMRQVGWIPPYRASGFAAAFVDMSE